MGSSNSKQNNENDHSKRRSSLRRVLTISSRHANKTFRPLSYAGRNQHYDEYHVSNRPISMINAAPLDNFEILSSEDSLRPIPADNIVYVNSLSISSAPPMHSNESSLQVSHEDNDDIEITIINKIDENDWKYYIPLTMDKFRTKPILKDLIYERMNAEFIHVLNRLIRLENTHEHESFLHWFFDEIEYNLRMMDEDSAFCQKPLLISTIEQDRFDCTEHLLKYRLLSSKLEVNRNNEHGRHCLLMLAHKNGPIDLIKYLLTNHASCLDTNKTDLNDYSSFHHATRHFNLSLCEILLPYTNKQTLQLENSELHTPVDYWLECMCSLKKLKPIHLQHNADSLRLEYLLNFQDSKSNIYFLQTLINRGGQLTKLPLRYIRSLLPQLTFEQKLSYIDHYIHLCCIVYKNRLSTLMSNYDQFKISIQASEILTEFICALGTIQVEVQKLLAENACSQKDEPTKRKEYESLQSIMRTLYANFFRLFDCIYNNPDVNVKNFHFEQIFRHVWIHWKEPVKAFIKQSKDKSILLKSMCRLKLFRCLISYPSDIQSLPVNSILKQFISFNNHFFVIERKI